ncbi:MAG TPA: hypothetical protein IAC59_04990 [Candidatus Fimadaptatus faecigallinarum]|uniref:Uncharacterized protein n=1 Tax=Candidatus Fimadaptatus faecigallinarum TaxID=2840814 RepID=A0A9D1S4F5_9FIRM|nr:hypothetical protein [Candidatus Fimadaptatus faecigallinarum]
MRSGMFGKLMAVLLAIMLVLPVAAQADDMNNGYTDITVSNLVVNYAGTEFDFSGIDLTLLAGVNAENRNALGGVMAKMTDSGNGAGLVVQMNEDSELMLLGNQLLKVPYAKMGETLAKLGVADADQLGDMTQQMDMFWSALASGAGAENSIGKLMEQYANSVNNNELVQQINALQAEAVPEPATFTVDGTEYEGQKISISLSADMLNEVMGSEAMQAYYSGVSDIIIQMAAQMGVTSVDVNGDMMPVDQFVTMVMSSVNTIKYAESITVDTYMAPYDDEKSVILIDYSPMTIDMSEYMAALNSLDESTTGFQSMITVDESIAMIGKLNEDLNMDNEDVEYLEVDAKVSDPTGGDASVSMNIKAADRDDEGSFSMNIDVPESDASDSASMVVAADWSDKDDAKTVNAKFEVYTADVLQAGVSFTGNAVDKDTGDNAEYTLNLSDVSGTNVTLGLSYNYTEADDDTGEGNVTLQYDDGTNGMMPLASVDYSTTESGTDETDVTDIVFSADVMGMVTASGKLSLRNMPMSAETLLPTEGAIDLSEADTEEVQTVLVNLQTNLQSLLMEAMNVPGVQQIMTMMQTTTSVETTATNAAVDVTDSTGADTVEDAETVDEPIAG